MRKCPNCKKHYLNHAFYDNIEGKLIRYVDCYNCKSIFKANKKDKDIRAENKDDLIRDYHFKVELRRYE